MKRALTGRLRLISKAWDSGVLETVTKKESTRYKEPHVSIIGHITADELYDRLDKRLLGNGSPATISIDVPTRRETDRREAAKLVARTRPRAIASLARGGHLCEAPSRRLQPIHSDASRVRVRTTDQRHCG